MIDYGRGLNDDATVFPICGNLRKVYLMALKWNSFQKQSLINFIIQFSYFQRKIITTNIHKYKVDQNERT